MPRLLLLTALAALACCPPALANDPPAAPPAPVGQSVLTPPPAAPAAPQTPAPTANTPAPVARKEETEVKIRSGFFNGLFADKGALTKEQAADEITKLRADNEALRKQLAEAQNELSAIAADWPAIREALLQGKPDAPVLQTPLGQQAAQAAAAAAAAQVAGAGHDPKKMPGPGAAKTDTGTQQNAPANQKPTSADLIKLGLQQHREKQHLN